MMPVEVKEMFDGMKVDVWQLHIKININYQIFKKSHYHNDLMKKSADLFFQYLNVCLFENILLKVGRLNDPSTTGKGKNPRKNWNMASLKELVERETNGSASPLGHLNPGTHSK